MLENKRYIALDLGAENGLVLAGLFNGNTIELDTLHKFPTGSVRLNNTLYVNFLNFMCEFKKGLLVYAGKYGSELDSIGCDSWGVDFAFLDRQGSLISNPVHYRDTRTLGIPEQVYKIIPQRTLYQRTGIQMLQINTIYQLYSMVKHDNPLLDKAHTMLMIADLCSYFLTGNATQEYTLASTTQMYDPLQKDWAKDTLISLGIPPGMLSPIVQPATITGTLYENIANECGVKAAPVVKPSCHDTACAVVGVPVEGNQEDWLFISSGTWSLMGVELNNPIINDKAFEKNFSNEGGVDGTIRFLKNIMGMWLIQQCKKTWDKEGDVYSYSELTKMAEQAKPFQYFINPNDIRFLVTDNMPATIAMYLQENQQNIPETKGDYIRLCLESLALSYKETALVITEITGKKYEAIYVVGGGSQNKLLNQMLADATGLVVKAGPVEATAYGNCLMQAMALGDISSLEQAREIVKKSVNIDLYEPINNSSQWHDAYERFLKL